MLAPILGALAILACALTVWLIRTRSTTEQDPDAAFWYAFTGACVLAPLVLGAAVLDPWLGMAVVAAVAFTALATNKVSTGSLQRRLAGEQASLLANEHALLAARHDSVLKAWSRYELDPGAALDHPAMNDVGIPATAALTRALAAAEQLRYQMAPAAAATGTNYQQAVVGLESAFALAQRLELQLHNKEASGLYSA